MSGRKSGERLIDGAVGRRVRQRRLLLGKSQTAVAKELGITFQQMQKNENGSNRISASRLYHLARILQVPMSYFFEDLPHLALSPSPDGVEEDDTNIHLSRQKVRLLKAFSRIHNAKTRKAVTDFVAQAAKSESPE